MLIKEKGDVMTAYKIQGFKWVGFEYLEEFETNTLSEALDIAHQLEDEQFHQIEIFEDDKSIFCIEK